MALNALVDSFCRSQKKCGTERANLSHSPTLPPPVTAKSFDFNAVCVQTQLIYDAGRVNPWTSRTSTKLDKIRTELLIICLRVNERLLEWRRPRDASAFTCTRYLLNYLSFRCQRRVNHLFATHWHSSCSSDGAGLIFWIFFWKRTYLSNDFRIHTDSPQLLERCLCFGQEATGYVQVEEFRATTCISFSRENTHWVNFL